MSDRIREKTQDLLDNYQPDPIEEGLKKELHKIVEDADKRHA
jgi:hypothetical protein